MTKHDSSPARPTVLSGITEYLRANYDLSIEYPIVLQRRDGFCWDSITVASILIDSDKHIYLEVQSDSLHIHEVLTTGQLHWTKWAGIFELADPQEFDLAIQMILKILGIKPRCSKFWERNINDHRTVP